MRGAIVLLGVGMLLSGTRSGAIATASDFPFTAGDAAALAPSMAALAERVLATDTDLSGPAALDRRFRLEIVAGRYAEAAATLDRLRLSNDHSAARSDTNYSQYAIFVQAKVLEAAGTPFGQAFAHAFAGAVDSLDDPRAAYVIRRFKILGGLQSRVDSDLAAQGGKSTISFAGALHLLVDYQLAEMYEAVAPYAPAAIERDDRRRYTIEQNVLIETPDRTHVCAFVVRPITATQPLPALLEYSIYADRRVVYDDARLSAAYGYAGVRAYTPGKACSRDPIVPYEREGSNVDAAIAWIARQPWSDGRVGMYGGSYNSFAQWAAAKAHPKALRAMMSSVSNAPGIDTPMEGNVFESWVYPWPLYVTAGPWLDASNEGDPSALIALEKKWYVSGKAYRAMDRLGGAPNPFWEHWLDHPSYDPFWQRLVPYKSEFGALDIPVLFTDGYLSYQNVGGYYYFSQYRRYRPEAEAYLVLGPYDHLAGQYGTVSSFGADADHMDGTPIDRAAQIDIERLRYQWFDFIFKGGPKPAILQGRVNYEVMHGDRWEHAASISAMHTHTMRVYLDRDRSQSIDLADRSDVNRVPPAQGIDTYLGFTFESRPLTASVEINGGISGVLDFVANKRDFDFDVTVFAQDRRGEYEEITNYLGRASYASDRARRNLLTPGARTRLAFSPTRITSWRLEAGTRIVVLVNVVKDPGYPVNFGTGKNVSDETIADGKVPLRIHWRRGSFVELPMR